MDCKSCRAYLKITKKTKKGKDLGQCRKLPPLNEGWPLVSEDDWCLGFKPQKDRGTPRA